MNNRSKLWPGFYIMMAAALWSTIGVVSMYSANPIMLGLFRSLFASLVSLFIRRSLNKASVITGIALGVLFAAYPIAAVMAGVGLAAFLLYTAPLWATLVALVMGEKPGRRGVIGVSLVIIAIVLIGAQTIKGSINMIGVFMGLLSGISYGSYIALARRFAKMGNEVDVSWGAIPYTLVVTALTAIAYSIIMNSWRPIVRPALWGIYLGIVTTVIPYRLFAMGVSRVRASTASVIATVEPVLAALWGFLFFKQIPTALTLIAYALIMVASIIVSFEETQ
ncbi:MAG: DMT family transporter [Vulcanisaeta sp.]|uniref:DMT family transporter n=1 Tax=Vulcanisaeta sp. TaxID=2020871 RepID=UPI003D125354